jgi:hypothetical protein
MEDIVFCDGKSEEVVLFLSLDMETVSDACLPDEPPPPEHRHPRVTLPDLRFSHSPVADALAFCLQHGLGVRWLPSEQEDPTGVEFFDFPLFYATSMLLCVGRRPPPEDMPQRIDALRHWFPDLPEIATLAPRDPFVAHFRTLPAFTTLESSGARRTRRDTH